MPIVRISMMEGRTDAQKAAAIAEVTDAVVRTLGGKPANVTVLLDEIPKAHFGLGGVQASKL